MSPIEHNNSFLENQALGKTLSSVQSLLKRFRDFEPTPTYRDIIVPLALRQQVEGFVTDARMFMQGSKVRFLVCLLDSNR